MSAPLSVFRRIQKLGKNKNTPPPYEFAKTLQNSSQSVFLSVKLQFSSELK